MSAINAVIQKDQFCWANESVFEPTSGFENFYFSESSSILCSGNRCQIENIVNLPGTGEPVYLQSGGGESLSPQLIPIAAVVGVLGRNYSGAMGKVATIAAICLSLIVICD